MSKKAIHAKPTVAQLALLAATLVTSKERPDQIDDLVKKALRIWKTADQLLKRPPPAPGSSPAEPKSLDKPEDYPVKVNAFLGFMLPHLNGRPGKQNPILRQYLDYELRRGFKPWPGEDPPDMPSTPTGPSKEDVDRWFAFCNDNPIGDDKDYRRYASRFRSWWNAELTAKRRAAGAMGLASEKRKSKEPKLSLAKPAPSS